MATVAESQWRRSRRHIRDELRKVARDLTKAKLLSHAEYCAAEGNPATPLVGDDPYFDKVAASGRSAALLNMDWMTRNGNERNKHPPATGYLANEVFTSVESGDTRIAVCVEQKARAMRRRLRTHNKKFYMARLIALWKEGCHRNCNLHYQKVRIAFAHLKARADVRVHMRTPMGRYLTREREQERRRRDEWTMPNVHFAGALSTDIQVLMPVPSSEHVNPERGSQ